MCSTLNEHIRLRSFSHLDFGNTKSSERSCSWGFLLIRDVFFLPERGAHISHVASDLLSFPSQLYSTSSGFSLSQETQSSRAHILNELFTKNNRARGLALFKSPQLSRAFFIIGSDMMHSSLLTELIIIPRSGSPQANLSHKLLLGLGILVYLEPGTFTPSPRTIPGLT